LKSSVERASSSKLTSVRTFIFLEWICNMWDQLGSVRVKTGSEQHAIKSVWQCTYLENSSPCLLCGVRELNFPIKTAWAHKCRVQYVCSVCGCYNLLATCLLLEICQFLTEIAHCHSILLSTCHLVNKAWKNL
jgi:hypothetical protein